MTTPGCRACQGSGDDWTGSGRRIDCERCSGAGVETCGECPVGSPPAFVVATYTDTCADGRTYESQVCADCAQRLTGLIETPSPCMACGYAQEGAGWGYVPDPGAFACEHAIGERRCGSCSEGWYQDGFQDTHDYDMVGDPPRYVGGAAFETCPSCVALDAADAERAVALLRADYEATEEPARGTC